jgi:hypothetical protein
MKDEIERSETAKYIVRDLCIPNDVFVDYSYFRVDHARIAVKNIYNPQESGMKEALSTPNFVMACSSVGTST